MALTTLNFTSSESLASPSIITFTDTSVGTDNTLTQRFLYIRLANGNWLTTSGESAASAYTVWDYADASITLDILSRSTAAEVTVVWLAGTTPTYSKTIDMEWILYDYIFLFSLLQTQTSNPQIINSDNFYPNCLSMIVNLFQAETAINPMEDIYSAQAALDRNYYFIQNQNYFF